MAPRLSDDRGWVDPKGYSTYDITMSVLSNAEMFGRQRQHFSRPPPKPDPEPQLLSSDTYEQFTDISADYSPDLMCLTEPGTKGGCQNKWPWWDFMPLLKNSAGCWWLVLLVF